MPVYFIQAGDDGPVKIGYAENCVSRRASMQVCNHEELHLRAIAEDKPEAHFHEKFAEHRIRGEWFAYTPELAAVMAHYERVEREAPPLEPAASVIAACGGMEATARLSGTSIHCIPRWLKSRARGGTGGEVPTNSRWWLEYRGVWPAPAEPAEAAR